MNTAGVLPWHQVDPHDVSADDGIYPRQFAITAKRVYKVARSALRGYIKIKNAVVRASRQELGRRCNADGQMAAGWVDSITEDGKRGVPDPGTD